MRPLPSPMAARMGAAAELFAERGLDQTKMEDIADATGVPKATLYYHFAGKEEILAHLFADTLRTMADAVAIALDAGGTAAQRLRAVIEAQLQVMGEHPAACRALVSNLGRAGRMPEIAAAIETAYYAPVAQLLAEGTVDGTLRELDEPDDTVTAIFGAVTLTGLQYLLRDTAMARDVASRLVDLLLSGIGADGASAQRTENESASRH